MAMMMVIVGAAGAAFMIVVVVSMGVMMMIVPVPVPVMVMIMVIVVAIRAADMVGVVMIEEVRIVLESTLQIERTLIQHLGEIDLRALGAMDAGGRIDRAHGCLDTGQLLSLIHI